jgi:hypothetical protein
MASITYEALHSSESLDKILASLTPEQHDDWYAAFIASDGGAGPPLEKTLRFLRDMLNDPSADPVAVATLVTATAE